MVISEVECYNAKYDEWTMCSSMSTERGNLSGATLNGKIFAIGGGKGSDCFSDVEMFDPALNRWFNSTSMLEKVCLIHLFVLVAVNNVHLIATSSLFEADVLKLETPLRYIIVTLNRM